MTRTLKVTSTKCGYVRFDLIGENGEKLAPVRATPYDARVCGREESEKYILTPEERLHCQMEAKKTLNL